MEKAIFNTNNGTVELLCSKCGKVIKTEEHFNAIEQSALDGNSSLMSRYCDEHQYMNMYGVERKRELLRRGIKEKLREGMIKKNVLNVAITRPDQTLVIMRGIPGSGKSTKTKSLLGKGIVHSTDDLIDATGDYNGYFKKMVDSGDWSEHGRMHNKNFLNHTTKISRKFWEATTGIPPIDDCIKKVQQFGYLHHIERLMVVGQFFLLTLTKPSDVFDWFISLVSMDSYEWVMYPNIYGMIMYADNGFMMSRPYFSSSNYIKKMSNYKKNESVVKLKDGNSGYRLYATNKPI